MQKAIGSAQQAQLQALLRRLRREAGLTQVQLGKRLGEPQSLVSDYERGERRLDLIELKQVCDALGVPLDEFVRQFLQAVSPPESA